jgi:hypothetical protein
VVRGNRTKPVSPDSNPRPDCGRAARECAARPTICDIVLSFIM